MYVNWNDLPEDYREYCDLNNKRAIVTYCRECENYEESTHHRGYCSLFYHYDGTKVEVKNDDFCSMANMRSDINWKVDK